MSAPPFRYLNWMKARWPKAESSLGGSGMSTPPDDVVSLASLKPDLDAIDVDGFPPLQERIARHLGVAPDRVLAGPGCTYASHVAVRSVCEPGSDVLIERPTYELLPRQVEGSGARPVFVRRAASAEFALDPAAVERAITPRTSAILLTNPHNPTGRMLPDATLAALAKIAESRRIPVVFDEVYLDFHPRSSRRWASAAALSDRFVSTGSLTKAHGLANLRVGWIAGPASVIAEARRWHDLLADRLPAWDAQAACVAFDRMDALRARARRAYESGFPVLVSWADSIPGMRVLDPGAGITAMVAAPPGVDTLAVAERLFEESRVLVVPGEMFDEPGWFRISFGAPREKLERGLSKLGRILRH